MDQSFSIKNLNWMLVEDIKNGGDLEEKYIPKAFDVKNKIKRLNKIRFHLKNKLKETNNDIYNNRFLRVNAAIDDMKLQYQSIVSDELGRISKSIESKEFRLNVNLLSHEVGGKKVYGVGNCLGQILVVKFIHNVLKELYDIRMASRDMVISQVKLLTLDDVPKYIIKTDIKSFYESIDHQFLLDGIHDSSSLSLIIKRILTRFISDYKRISGDVKGVPRGIGLSAYLSEIYLSDIDKEMKRNEDLIYYGRYVDDMIFIYAPVRKEAVDGYINEIGSILEKKKLFLNEDKTSKIDLLDGRAGFFDYLGYKFNLGGNKILLSRSRIDKYISRINQSFEEYDRKRLFLPKKAEEELICRCVFLTGNIRLFNRKSNAFIGVYFSNKYITDTCQLDYLDDVYQEKISSSCASISTKRKIKKLSFRKGFDRKLFGGLTKKQILHVSKGWKND